MSPVLDTNGYTVGIICPLSVELTAARVMLDEVYPRPSDLNTRDDDNTYTYGSINGHAVVMTSLPMGNADSRSAAHLINPMTTSFRQLRVVLLVGIGGGIPVEDAEADGEGDIRLGDIVVGCVSNKTETVIDVERGSHFPPPEHRIRNVLSKLDSNRMMGSSSFADGLNRCISRLHTFNSPGSANDKLYEAAYEHVSGQDRRCGRCASDRVVARPARENNDEPKLHFGVIACVSNVVKNAAERDSYRREYGAICVEMEAAGIFDRQNCLVIRGISDYADSHKNDQWQKYAAATAASFMREILYTMDPGEVREFAPVDGSGTAPPSGQQGPSSTTNSAAADPPPPPPPPAVGRTKEAESNARYLIRLAANTRSAATSSATMLEAISTFEQAIRQLQPPISEDILLAHALFGLVECHIDLADRVREPAYLRLDSVERGEAALRRAEEVVQGERLADQRFRATVYGAVLAAQKALLRANRNASTRSSWTAEERDARITLQRLLEHDIRDSPGGEEYRQSLETYLRRLQ